VSGKNLHLVGFRFFWHGPLRLFEYVTCLTEKNLVLLYNRSILGKSDQHKFPVESINDRQTGANTIGEEDTQEVLEAPCRNVSLMAPKRLRYGTLENGLCAAPTAWPQAHHKLSVNWDVPTEQHLSGRLKAAIYPNHPSANVSQAASGTEFGLLVHRRR
jgi:hypothetical protein